MDFNIIWSRILDLKGTIFRTAKNYELFYAIDDDCVLFSRAKGSEKEGADHARARKDQVKKAFELLRQSQNPQIKDIHGVTTGPAYIFATFKDPRIGAI